VFWQFKVDSIQTQLRSVMAQVNLLSDDWLVFTDTLSTAFIAVNDKFIINNMVKVFYLQVYNAV
jgi:hypothetical protein